MQFLANTYKNPYPLQERALNQCARELLLAQSSDWPFIITMNTMVDYAHKRVRDHIGLEKFKTIVDAQEKYIEKFYEDLQKKYEEEDRLAEEQARLDEMEAEENNEKAEEADLEDAEEVLDAEVEEAEETKEE